MEKRIGTVIIYVGDRLQVPQLNEVLSRHADIIICRQGFPRDHYSLISVVFEGTTDRIGSLTGQLGRIEGIEVKSALLALRHYLPSVGEPSGCERNGVERGNPT